MMKVILGIFILAGFTVAQAHNVVLTWNDVICSATITANCNVSGTTYNVYRAPGSCPAAGVAPSSAPIPFSVIVNVIASTGSGSVLLSHTDANVISPGQAFCYYVTAVNGYTVNNATGLVVLNESAPSNYAQAALVATGSTPLAPSNTKSILQ